MPFLLSQMLDFCRWVGGFIVLSVHSTNMFVSLKDIMEAHHAAPVFGWWFFASFELGHQAVIGFFVMSGYLVGGAVIANIRKGKDYLRDYLIHRFSRIYIVTVPALVVTLLADSIGRDWMPEKVIYDMPLFKDHLTVGVFAMNVFNLQTIYSPFFGTNSPLWSLACEFWYYISFPLLLAPLARNYSPLMRYGGFAVGLFLLVALTYGNTWFAFGFLLWAIGALATLPRRPFVPSRWLAFAMLAGPVIAIRLLVRGPVLAAHPWIQELADFVETVLFANLLVTMRFGPEQGWDLLRPRFHKTLADFSYSLYCIHMPLLFLLRAAVDSLMGPDWAPQLATPEHWLTLALALTLVIAFAYGFSRLTEAHTGAARRYLSARLPRFAVATG